jgi:hypothetical protein
MLQRSYTMRAMRRCFLGAVAVVGGALACEAEPAPIVPKSELPARHAPAAGAVGGSDPAVLPASGTTGHVGSAAAHGDPSLGGSDGRLGAGDDGAALEGEEEEEEDGPSDDPASAVEGGAASGGAPGVDREEWRGGGATSTGGDGTGNGTGSGKANGNGGARDENVGGGRNAAGGGGSAGAAGTSNKEPVATEEHRYALMQVVTSGSPP